MSRSNPNITNPASHFMEWSGGKGELSYYDKETKENVKVKLPFEFLVLDELATVTGYNKLDKKSYYSNEVRNVSKEELTVKVAGVTRQTGLYKDLADVRAKGGKYAKSVYLAHKVGDDYIIDNFKAAGSALSAWIDFSKGNVVANGKVIMTRGEKQESGVGDFYPPAFEYVSATPEEDSQAIALDKVLQVYLSQYLAAAEHNRSDDEVHTTTDESQAGVDMSRELTDEELAEVPAEKQGTLKAARNWENVGKGSNSTKDIDDAEAASLYQSYAEAEDNG